MGILDTITQLAGQAGDAAQTDQAKVAGGFLQALTAHPEGLQGVLPSLTANGLGGHVGSWLQGQGQAPTTDQVNQGLGSTGLIEKTAEHAGVSPAVVSAALATVLPLVIQHFGAAQNTQAQAAGQPADNNIMASLAQSVLGKLVS